MIDPQVPAATQLDRAANWLLDQLSYPVGTAREWPLGLFKAAVFLFAWWIAARLFVNLAMRIVRKFTKHTRTNFDDRLLAIAEKPVRRLIVIAGLYYAIDALPLPEGIHRFGTGIVYVVAVYLVVKLAHALFLLLISVYGSAVRDPDGKVQFEKDYLPLVSKVTGTILAIVGLSLVLHHFGQNVQSLVAALGVGGIAIGFAAKETLGNMMAGFAILVDRPFRPGDRIKLASGEVGDVLLIGTRSTRLKLPDGNMLIVSNSELTTTRVVNFNFPTHMMRATLEVGVAHGTDLDAAKKVVLDILAGEKQVLKDPAPAVLFTKFGEWTLNLNAYYFVSDFTLVGEVEDRVRDLVRRRFVELGIKIPFPTREIIGGSPGARAQE